MGENINISSYSSKLSAYGMATSGTQGITTVKDGLVIQTVADGGQARGIYNEQDGITTIGNKAVHQRNRIGKFWLWDGCIWWQSQDGG